MKHNSVLIIVENLPVPFDTRVWKEARALKRNGYDVSVLSPQGKGYRKSFEVIDGIRIFRHSMPQEGKGALGYFFEYSAALFFEWIYTWRIFFTYRFAIIQGCNPPDTIFLIALFFKLFGVKFIFDHHDVNPELYQAKFGKRGLFYRVLLILERMTFHVCDVVMSTNQSYREIAEKRGKKESSDVFIVRNGPDTTFFNPVPPNTALKYGKKYLIGYVGTMGSQEGVDLLIRVALRIKEMNRRDIHFTCIGGGPALKDLRRMKMELGLDDMMNFTGRIPDRDMVEILSTADVCVNPDIPNDMNSISTMIKVMEYMALGKPIIQFDLKEGRFSAQSAALYIDNKANIDDFVIKLTWLLDRPKERLKMGISGRNRIERELDWKYSVPHLLKAYERAIHKKGDSKFPIAHV